jgi:hypothetical protein
MRGVEFLLGWESVLLTQLSEIHDHNDSLSSCARRSGCKEIATILK